MGDNYQTPSPARQKPRPLPGSSKKRSDSNQESPWHGNHDVVYPFNEDLKINGALLKKVQLRADERLVVELLNAPLSMPVPHVDMVILYYKDCTASELCRVKAFHAALISFGLKINLFRDNDGGYLFAKIFIPYDVLLMYSEFKFANEEQYTTVQRVYAIRKIINKTCVLTKYITDAHYERYDYRRLVDDGIIASSYVPHEAKANAELLNNWAKIWNLLNPQPIDAIKEYYGALVAIHFAWSGYFNVALLLGCVFGLFSFIGSLTVAHSEYAYPIEEVCAGVYDFYPRCPVCVGCDYESLSSTCNYRRELRNRSNITFCVLIAFLVTGLITSFKSYISKLTASWEEPNTRLDVIVHHLAMTSQKRLPKYDASAAVEHIRIAYLQQYPGLLKIYDLAEKPPGDYEGMSNVSLQRVNLYNTPEKDKPPHEKIIPPSPKNTSEAADDDIVSIADSINENRRESIHNLTLTAEEFTDMNRKKLVTSDESGFVMTQNKSYSDDFMTEEIAKEQDEAIFQIHGMQAFLHCLITWCFTFIFFFYFVFIFLLYVCILGQFNHLHFLIMAVVNSYLNIITRVINRKVVWYITYYQTPKYESQFNKWLSMKLLICYLTEYAQFFYTASFGEFYFSNPERLKGAPFNVKPCKQDDCHWSLSKSVAKILTVDQLIFLSWASIYPLIPNNFWCGSCCISRCWQGYAHFTWWFISFQNRIIRYFTLIIYNFPWYNQEKLPPRTKSYSMGPTPTETWYTDSKRVGYDTQPFMLHQYLTMMKMFGYVALFGANWFWAPFVLYMTSLIYIRIHATNLLTNHRRPLPDRAKGLGIWVQYLNSMVLASFVANGFTFSFLADFASQTIHYTREGTLAYYFNSTLSLFDTKQIQDIFGLPKHAREYCVYNGNMEPPWSQFPATLNGTGCFRLFYKLIFFGIYSAIFQLFCHWLRFDIVALFDSLCDMTIALCRPIFKRLNKIFIPTPYVYSPEESEDSQDEQSGGKTNFVSKILKRGRPMLSRLAFWKGRAKGDPENYQMTSFQNLRNAESESENTTP